MYIKVSAIVLSIKIPGRIYFNIFVLVARGYYLDPAYNQQQPVIYETFPKTDSYSSASGNTDWMLHPY